ncbi:uncharacterized protein C8orf76 homolog isoform X2 [Dreissena polymorpha]|uniref:uncharacterized protein C8orf76 homolog isoform X2 n=1 Tax=Dreissena polymorpha TaxID=45954 RepID=UPI00226401AF|nr:uncharacterized protein C8orf76 homolog isoform X2 [Dreissena polymorpha]
MVRIALQDMELGFDFDDNDFSKKEEEKTVLKSYNAKFCPKKWFLADKADNSENDPATLNKFRADFCYYQKNTGDAIEFYRKALDCLGGQIRTMRREIQESLVRCYLHIGWHTEAAKGIDLMMGDCLTVDHHCQAFMLKLEVHKASGDLTEEIRVLYQLISLHPVNAFFWLKLADAYSRLGEKHNRVPAHTQLIEGSSSLTSKSGTECATVVKINNDQNTGIISLEHSDYDINKQQDQHNSKKRSAGHDENVNDEINKEIMSFHIRGAAVRDPSTSTGDGNVGDGEEIVLGVDKLDLESEQARKGSGEQDAIKNSDANITQLFVEYPYDLILLTCLVRARLILQCVQSTVGTFIKDRNVALVNEINRKIECLGIDGLLAESVCKFVRRDIVEDDVKDENSQTQTIEHTLNMISTEDFHRRWFAWINEDRHIT